jgi:hypothetical protein
MREDAESTDLEQRLRSYIEPDDHRDRRDEYRVLMVEAVRTAS